MRESCTPVRISRCCTPRAATQWRTAQQLQRRRAPDAERVNGICARPPQQPVEHALRDATSIDCSDRCAGRARTNGASECKERFQALCDGRSLPACHPRSGWPYRVACDLGAEDARHRRDGACRPAMASRLSARGPRNGPDAHRMAETQFGAQPDSRVGKAAGRAVAAMKAPPTGRFGNVGIETRHSSRNHSGIQAARHRFA